MYKVIVCKIKTFPHPNADNIQLGNVKGFQVVIDKNIRDGEIGIYFPTDGQLDIMFAEANDLITRKDEEGNRAGGYFGKNRRVRAQTFRGEKSEGFWIELKSLDFLSSPDTVGQLKEGDQFNELAGVPICNKYFTPATLKGQCKKDGILKRANSCFSKHRDTEQLKYELDFIPVNSIIYLTEKLHGTSGRFGYVLDEVKEPLWKRPFLFLMGKPTINKVYKHLIGTRNMILQDHTDGTNWEQGPLGYRYNVVKDLYGSLYKGEIIYFEIVGYTSDGGNIMSSAPISPLKDKTIRKKYGDIMEFKYGCKRPNADIYVYRIKRTNEDGVSIDLTWQQLKNRCKFLGLKHVPEVFPAPMIMYGNSKKHREQLLTLVESKLENSSLLDDSHISEGIVIRLENKNGVNFLKQKSHIFYMLEGILKNKDDYVDEEEIS